MYYFVLLLLLLFPLSVFGSRLDPVIVSSRTESQSSNLTSSHTVIDNKTLEKENVSVAIEALRNVPGVYITQSGGLGAQASIFIRGSEVRHVLVLIDGIKVNDPSNPDKQFNAANLSTLDIEKIEVIKGAQSVLYGSDAIGGVINIVTKKGEPKQTVGVELGFQKQIHGSMSVVGERGVTYLNSYYAESEGISAKKDADELDGFFKKGVTLNHSQSFDSFEAKWMIKIMQDYVEDDGYDASYKFVDDKNAYSKSLQQIYNQTITKNTNSGTFKYSIALNKIDRSVKFYDTNRSDYSLTAYSGSNLIQDITFLKKFGLGEAVVGLSHEYETFNKSGIDQRKANLYSVFTSVNHMLKRNFLNIGLRSDTHETFGNVFTYNLGVGRKFSGRKQIKFNHATGFKAPSIYQLFVPYDGAYKVGNEDLQPERSRTFDLSFKQMGANSYEITLFNNFIYDYFYYSSDGYENKGSFNSQGLEVSASQKTKQVILKEGITLAKFDLSDDDEVLRRPEQKIDFNIDYNLTDNFKLNAHWKWIATRYDSVSSQEVVMDAYDLTNISVRYQHFKNDYLLGINNLFDREYEDIAGYGTMGLTLFARANFNY